MTVFSAIYTPGVVILNFCLFIFTVSVIPIGCISLYLLNRPSLVAQLVKNLPEMWETWVRSLGWEDPLEKGKATHTSVFWLGEFHGLYSPWGRK